MDQANYVSYILSKNPTLWTPTIANGLRACSSSLFVLAERNSTLRKYCDVLESVITAVMDHVEQTSSPDPASTTFTNARSPAKSTISEGPRAAFDQSRTTFEKTDWEFPSQAYPSYTLEANETSNGDQTEPQPLDSRQVDPTNVAERWGDAWFLSAVGDMRTNQWDMASMGDGALDPTSEAYFFNGDLTRQIMDDLLATRDIAT